MKKWRIFILCLLAVMCNATAYANTPVSIAARAYSDSSYVFRIKGSNQEFLLVEETDDAKSKFFVYAIGYYGRKVYNTGGRHKFDPLDPESMAYFINNDFVKKGNTSGFTRLTYKLPQSVIDHIDFNHVWTCEAGKNGSDAGMPYNITCGIAVPSQRELIRYKDRIGWDDDYRSIKNDAAVSPWCIRSTTDWGEIMAVRPNISMTSISTLGAPSNVAGIRPIFYLDVNFFKEVRIDLQRSGDGILEMFKRYYTIDEMKLLYTQQECNDYLGYKSEVTVETDEEGFVISNNKEQALNGMLVAIFFDNGDIPIGQKNTAVNLNANSHITLPLPDNNIVENASYAKVYVYASGGTAKRYGCVSNSCRINF